MPALIHARFQVVLKPLNGFPWYGKIQGQGHSRPECFISPFNIQPGTGQKRPALG